jgi:hypothetical protein
MAEELTFPEAHIDELNAIFDSGQAQGVIDFIGAFPTIEQRKELYRLAQRTFGRAVPLDLDSLIAIVRAGIADLLAAADSARSSDDIVTANSLTDSANAFSYNLSADLAECWPGDATPRTQTHFEAGLTAAQDCLRWRKELNKGKWSFSIAWWAKGAHELSLGRAADAVESFRESRRYSEAAAAEKEDKQDSNTDFGCVLANGYLGLALTAAGDPAGNELFKQACDQFAAMIPSGGEAADDARFGKEQLETIRAKIMARR